MIHDKFMRLWAAVDPYLGAILTFITLALWILSIRRNRREIRHWMEAYDKLGEMYDELSRENTIMSMRESGQLGGEKTDNITSDRRKLALEVREWALDPVCGLAWHRGSRVDRSFCEKYGIPFD